MKKFITLAIVLLIPISAYSAGGADICFERPDQMPSTGIGCQGAVSPFKNNMVITEWDGGTNRILWTKDASNRRNNQITLPATSRRFEVSDKGPVGYINVAYLDGSGTSAKPYLSTNSGSSFSQLNPSGVGSFTTFRSGSFGAGGTNVSSMKFGTDGNLYVYYFTRHASFTDQWNFNLQVYDKNGASLGSPQVLSGASPLIRSTGLSADSFISTTVTDTSVIAVARPGHWWDPSCGAGCYREDEVVAYVWDIASQTLTQTVGIGHALTSLDHADSVNPYGSNGLTSSSLLTSDGNSVYYFNGIAPINNERSAEVRRFPPLGGGKYFPENSGGAPIPYTDLTQISAPFKTSDVIVQGTGGANGSIYHFAAPRYKSNHSNLVDFTFTDGIGAPLNYYRRIRFNPSLSFASQNAQIQVIHDMTNEDLQQLDPGASITDVTDGSSLSSVYGGTVAMFCFNAGSSSAGKNFHAIDFN